VISTASYEARKYGVRSGMACPSMLFVSRQYTILTKVLPAFVAKKLCPDLILLKSHYDRYSEMSDKIMAIFERYDPTMLAAGCDEGYLKCVMAATFKRIDIHLLYTQHHELL
jgi:DNA polymerase kappa